MGDSIIIYTDGACWNNPGPAGIGVFLQYKNHMREIGTYIGEATNNIAELTAIQRALLSLKTKQIPVIIYTDSKYCVGVLTQYWNAKKNIPLIAAIRDLINKFDSVEIEWVRAHSGIPGNEKADQLATNAIKNYKKKKKKEGKDESSGSNKRDRVYDDRCQKSRL